MIRIFVLTVIFVLSVNKSHALSCVSNIRDEGLVKMNFTSASLVVEASVVNQKNPIGIQDVAMGSSVRMRFTSFEIHKLWKGIPPNELIIDNLSKLSGNPNVFFVDGSKYLLYLGDKDGDVYSVLICTPPILASQAESEIAILRNIKFK